VKVASIMGIRSQFVKISIVSRKLDVDNVVPIPQRTENTYKESKLLEQLKTSVILILLLDFLDFIKLICNVEIILTDLEGTQKDACILKVQRVTLKENTEWVKTIDHEWNVLISSSTKGIIKTVSNLKLSFTCHGNACGERLTGVLLN
jgi:UDP-N-acetylglucosamine 2-epimerase